MRPRRLLLLAPLLLACCSPASPGSSPPNLATSAAEAQPAPDAPTAPSSDPAAEAPAPAAAPEPALAADAKKMADDSKPKSKSIDELKDEARKDLGDRTSFALVREHFLVVSSPGWGASGAKGSADFIERVLKALFNQRFARGPSRPLPVYLFADATSYNAYCKKRYGEPCISIYGFFSPRDYRLVMNVGLGIGTLSHELVHPLVDADFPEAPTWINEGIASLFEQPILPKDGEIHGAKNWRFPRLSAGLSNPKERARVTLPGLFVMSDETFRNDDEDLHYAMARYFCQWMDAQGKLWPFYQAWRDNFASDPLGEKAFAKVMGKSVDDAGEAWLRWLRGILAAGVCAWQRVGAKQGVGRCCPRGRGARGGRKGERGARVGPPRPGLLRWFVGGGVLPTAAPPMLAASTPEAPLLLSVVLDPFALHNPFAVSVRIALDHALSADLLDQMFDQHAELQYTRTLTFSSVVEVMTAVVLRQARSVRDAYERKLKDVGVSLTSLYSKLAGVELATAQAFVRLSARRFGALVDALGPVEPWVRGLRVKIVDGNYLGPTEHRLAPLHTTAAAALPGMSLVVYEPERKLIADVFLSEDAYTQERTLLDAVLATVQANELWVGDRAFAIASFFLGLWDRKARFLLREHGANTVWEPLDTKPHKEGGIDTGMVFEQRVRLHLGHGKWKPARRISLKLKQPTQDGDTEIHLICNVPRGKLSARRIAEIYRDRWQIEHVFLDLTKDLRCEVNTLAYPKAALFAFCTALVSFNTLAVCKQAIAVEHGKEAAEALSSYAMVGDISSAMRAMEVLVTAEQSEAWEQASAAAVARLLRKVARGVKVEKYRKAERGPKKEKAKRRLNPKQTHVATARLLPQRP